MSLAGKWLRYYSETYFVLKKEDDNVVTVKVVNAKIVRFTKENMDRARTFKTENNSYEKVLIKALFREITSSSEW
jgi:hypothetical protein